MIASQQILYFSLLAPKIRPFLFICQVALLTTINVTIDFHLIPHPQFSCIPPLQKIDHNRPGKPDDVSIFCL